MLTRYSRAKSQVKHYRNLRGEDLLHRKQHPGTSIGMLIVNLSSRLVKTNGLVNSAPHPAVNPTTSHLKPLFSTSILINYLTRRLSQKSDRWSTTLCLLILAKFEALWISACVTAGTLSMSLRTTFADVFDPAIEDCENIDDELGAKNRTPIPGIIS
jgi:hypothetical protein